MQSVCKLTQVDCNDTIHGSNLALWKWTKTLQAYMEILSGIEFKADFGPNKGTLPSQGDWPEFAGTVKGDGIHQNRLCLDVAQSSFFKRRGKRDRLLTV